MKAIITGATKGIGRAIAEILIHDGFDLALNSRNQDDLEACRSELLSLNPKAEILIFKTDMSQKDDVHRFGEFVLQNWQNVDVLINNAGVFLSGPLMDEPTGNLEKMIETNLYSAYYLSRMIVPGMCERKSGHIINICSIASFMAYPNGGSYSISKFAMLGLSKVMREELKSFGVRVTSVMPGATWSNSWAGIDLPEERLMPAKDIALVVQNAIKLSPASVIEDIVIRPQLGDL